uniref:Subtilisin-like protease fibronectin type-III domain-containing protein n=1 Tax=Populus alba TaxID=43335 RepID=A0A4U5NL38_POPAL|nr:hypothetical protein D5086_0000268750 [Populus alba]
MDSTRKLIGRSYPNDTQATPFDFRSGHINPLAALNPGLIYSFDSNDADYPAGVQVTVTPAHLKFTKTGENMSFRIDFKLLKTSDGNFVFGALTWSNGVHKVRSPIALKVLSL